jgi:cytochrome P450
MPRGGTVDLQPLFGRLSLDIATAFIFGEPMNCLRQPNTGGEHDFASAFSAAQMLALRRMRSFGLDRFLGEKQFWRACDTVHQFADRLIEKRLTERRGNAEGQARLCLLDALAKEASSRQELRDQVINILLAARDTTASALSWTM